MSKYQKYAEYKYSGVEWLEKIPNHWEATQVKYGYVVTLGKMLQSTPKSSLDELKPYLKAQNVQPNGISINQVELMWFSPEDRKKLLLEKGDVLVSEGGDVGRSAIWNAELEECYIQNAINRVRPKYMNDSKYFLYWMEFLKSTDFINIICNKATIAHYTAEKLESSPIFLPPSSEQNKIANFLDHETAKIDTLIAKQEKLIELLKEKRQAVISHAVTKGLNPNIAMKDSGVEWLGEVPDHWIVTKFGFHTLKIGSGKTPKGGAEIYQDEGILFIRSQNVYNDGLRVESSESTYISEAIHDDMSTSKVYSGDILLNITGGSIGRSCLVPDEFPEANVNQHVCIIRVSKYLQEFLALVIQSDLIQAQIQSIQTGGNREGLNFEQISNFYFALPPTEEQKELVKYLEDKVLEFSKLEVKAHNAIQLMQERRTALISAAVTGKIDVRNWQNPNKNNEVNMELSA